MLVQLLVVRPFAAGGPFSGLRFAIPPCIVVAKAGYGDFRREKMEAKLIEKEQHASLALSCI